MLGLLSATRLIRINLCVCRDMTLRATLNKSLVARSSLFWAVCGLANPRHSWSMAVVCALQPIPNQDAHTREDLFSMALVLVPVIVTTLTENILPYRRRSRPVLASAKGLP